MSKKKQLTREEYAKKFKDQLQRANYQLKEGEKIIQCRDPYPDYWFISNQGYIFTAFYNDLHILNDNPTEQGLKDKDGKRRGKKWRYVSDKCGDVTAWKIMAEYFLTCEFDLEDGEKVDIHHIKPRSDFEPDQGSECNRPDNLQILPERIHAELSKYTSPNYEKNSEKKTIKALEKGTAHMTITDQLTPEFVKALLQGTTWESGAAFYLKNLNTNETLAFPVPEHVAGDPLPDILNWTCSREFSPESHKN